MYVPEQFRDDDTTNLVGFMRRHDFATLVSNHDGMPLATHLPLLVTHVGDAITLHGHVARANPQWRSLASQDVLAVFTGPHAYVSPSLYERRESVPTWNYLAVHAYGTVRLVEGVDEVTGMLDALIERHEHAYRAQWDDLPEAYRGRMMDGLVGFEMTVMRLHGAAKLSQNKSRAEQRRIALALLESDDGAARETGAEMRRRQEMAEGQ